MKNEDLEASLQRVSQLHIANKLQHNMFQTFEQKTFSIHA